MEKRLGSIYAEKTESVRRKMLEEISRADGTDGLQAGSGELDRWCREMIEEEILNEENLSIAESEQLIRLIYAKVRTRLGVLTPLVENETISEIMVNGPEHVFIEDHRGIRRADVRFESTEELEEIIRNIAAGVHREINETHPILDARLRNGSRVNAVYRNLTSSGPILTIRKFSKERITIAQMVKAGTLTEECADYLKKLVQYGFNLFISGGTSTGKTTFLNALTDFIPAAERVIVIEDSRELMIANVDNLVQMECHNANSLGRGQVSMDMLIKTSLRMRPDRIIVGEIRGKEALDMLQAMNTGHAGSMSTGHGNSVQGMLRRLEAMYLMNANIPMDSIRAQIVEGIDIMIHLARTVDGVRRVVEIQELVGHRDGNYILNPLFLVTEKGGVRLGRTGNRLIRRQKLMWRGGDTVDGL